MYQAIQSRVKELETLIGGLSPNSVLKPTLVYFGIIGIAWPIRCLLHIKAVDYDYVPISLFEWQSKSEDGAQPIKSVINNGHIPLYVDKESSINDSTLIIKTLAHRYDLMGNNDKEALQIEHVLAHCYDAVFHWSGLFSVNMRFNISDEVAQARLNAFMGGEAWCAVKNGYRQNLDAFARLLEANPSSSGFMVGEQLSAADLSAFNVLCNWYKSFDRDVFSGEYPVLDEYIQRIAVIPEITSYIRDVQEPTLWFEGLSNVALRLTSREELKGLVELKGSAPFNSIN